MSCRLVSSIEKVRREVRAARRSDETVGLVPTMGALHEGHLALIRRSIAACDRTLVTLFVNPTQFTQRSDLERYPRDLDADLETCRRAGVDWLFAPSDEEMYPEEPLTFVEVFAVSEGLCGDYRPGHFRGVATVCAKLFGIAQADRAYFGEKDYQQLAVIRRLVADLNIPLEIVGVPTVREEDGLALSSRNRLLGDDQRLAAPVLYTALQGAQAAAKHGLMRDSASLIQLARDVLAEEPQARVEYVEIVDRDTIAPVADVDVERRMAMAVWIGDVRLIDNIAIGPAP